MKLLKLQISVAYAIAVTLGFLFFVLAIGLQPAHGQNPIFFQTAFSSAQVATPAFSPTSPYSGGNTTVTITDTTPSSTILYCTDTTNTCTPATTYTAGLSFTATEYIRAYATAAGLNPSPVTSWSGTWVNLPQVLQSNSSPTDCTGGTCTVTLPNHAAGGMTCVIADYANSVVDTNKPTNTAAYTWTQVATTCYSVHTQEMWCAAKSAYASTDTFSLTFPASTFHGGLWVADVSVVTAVDNSACATGSTSSVPTTNITSLTGPNDMLLASGRGSLVSTQGAGFTCATCAGAGNWGSSYDVGEYEQITGTTGTATLSPGGQNPWSLLVTALK